MELRTIRKDNKLTQQEASKILGIPLRTYIRYEKEEEYQNSYKYASLCNKLYENFRVDEEHGILTIEEIKIRIKIIFTKYDIEFAYLFGSYAKGCAKDKSDIDIMICSDITGLDYFGLVEELRNSLNKKIDLVRLKDIKVGSELLTEILRYGIRIYG